MSSQGFSVDEGSRVLASVLDWQASRPYGQIPRGSGSSVKRIAMPVKRSSAPTSWVVSSTSTAGPPEPFSGKAFRYET